VTSGTVRWQFICAKSIENL